MKTLSLSVLETAVCCGLALLLSPSARAQAAAVLEGNAGRPPLVDPTKPATTGTLTSSDANRPPPFVEGADARTRSSNSTEAAAVAIPPGIRAKVDAGHVDWLKDKGGAAFRSHLSYFGGYPLLMLVTSSDEPAPVKARRFQAIVEACEVHLNEEAFNRTVICVAEINAQDPTKVTTRNVEVSRGAFQSAVARAGDNPNRKSALARIRGDDSGKTFANICADLGIR